MMEEERFLFELQLNETFEPSVHLKMKNVICFDYSFGIKKDFQPTPMLVTFLKTMMTL